MINLKFLSIHVEGFQSIDNISLDFTNLGMCLIKGINLYDTKTKSNGSGKSSLCMSIPWVLFGKTPTGIGNEVVNKFSNTGCCVELKFIIDDINYIIRRSVNHHKYKTNIMILKDSKDISGRNKTDSDKLIKNILKMDEEIFSQMIFLSQGFTNRFSVYSPKARKELLESLYSVNERLNDFVSDLKSKELIIKNDIDDCSKSIFSLNTKNEMLENTISNNKFNISKTNDQIVNLQNTKSHITKNDIDELQLKYDDLNFQIEKITEKHTIQYSKVNDLNIKLNELANKKHEYEQEINNFSNNKVCPTCGTVLEDYEKNEHIQKHINELKNKILNIINNIELLQNEYSKENNAYSRMSKKLSILKTNRDSIKNELIIKSNEYQHELQKDTQIKALQDKIIEYTNTINTLNQEINYNTKKLIDLNSVNDTENKKLEIIQHSIRLANNQFKSYLLENIINLLNDKLKELSVLLFESEIIKIQGDSKLDILLDDKVYESCSGGEKTKIDIAIIIAQRFLAQQMNSISSNILILDEVFDGLDDVSFSIVLDLLSDELQDVESTFIISHRDMKEIPFDNIITIVKDKNKLSNIQ